jgi:AcrR family transcriptional regulator
VTPPSIYRHFADKDEMLSAVCAGVFVQLTDGIAQAVASGKSPLEALAEAGRCYVQFGLAHPEHYRLVFMRAPFKDDDVDHADLRTVLESGEIPESHPLFSGPALAGSQAFKALYDLVEAVLEGLPKRRRPDAFTVTTAMWTAMHGITSLRISKPDFVWPSVEEQVEALLWPWRRVLAD